MFLGLEKLSPSDVSSHRDCRLGKWYTSKKTVDCFRNHASYRELDHHHEPVHIFAKAAVEACNSGNLAKAEQALQEIENASKQVIYN